MNHIVIGVDWVVLLILQLFHHHLLNAFLNSRRVESRVIASSTFHAHEALVCKCYRTAALASQIRSDLSCLTYHP